MEDRRAKIQEIKEAIGAWLREIRESRGETLQQIADRIIGDKKEADRGAMSKLEKGISNPTMGMFFQVLLYGYHLQFEQLCEHFVAEDVDRDREERVARRLMEQLLRQGAPTRKEIIELLENLKAPDS